MKKKQEKKLFGLLSLLLFLLIIILALFLFEPFQKTPSLEVITQEEILVQEESFVSPSNTIVSKNSVTATPLPKVENDTKSYLKTILAAAAGTKVEKEQLLKEEIEQCFFYTKIEDEIFLRIEGKSFGEDCTVDREELRYVKVLHYGFDKQVYVGELIVNQEIARDITDIFFELFEAAYPIEKIRLIDEYEADDEKSMTDNNTSSFNFRKIAGSTQLSKHARGLAIDINPLYNPYVKGSSEAMVVQPAAGKSYVNREVEGDYYIKTGDLCYEAFAKRGFLWGGDWNTVKDYQHFELP